jgi:ribosomal protein S18 acetylase RimI-like enzyme
VRVWRAAPEEAPAVVRRRGCRRVELDVNSENPAAFAFYRSLGFETGKTGGRDLLMRRRL